MARLGGLGPRVAWPFFWLNRPEAARSALRRCVSPRTAAAAPWPAVPRLRVCEIAQRHRAKSQCEDLGAPQVNAGIFRFLGDPRESGGMAANRKKDIGPSGLTHQ